MSYSRRNKLNCESFQSERERDFKRPREREKDSKQVAKIRKTNHSSKTMRTKRKSNSKLIYMKCQSVPHKYLPARIILFSNLLALIYAVVIVTAINFERYADESGARLPASASASNNRSGSNLSSADYAIGSANPSMLVSVDELDAGEPIDGVERLWRRQVDLAADPFSSLLDSDGGGGGSNPGSGFAAAPEPLVAGLNGAAYLDYDAYRPMSDPFGANNPANMNQPTEQSYQRRALSTNGDLSSGGHSKSLVLNGQTPAGSPDQQQQQQHSKMGPQFIKEPPSYISYLNSTDLVIPCSASGNPAPTIVSSIVVLDWLKPIVFKFITVRLIPVHIWNSHALEFCYSNHHHHHHHNHHPLTCPPFNIELKPRSLTPARLTIDSARNTCAELPTTTTTALGRQLATTRLCSPELKLFASRMPNANYYYYYDDHHHHHHLNVRSKTWWHKSSQLETGSLLDKRYIRYDNSLVISALKAHDYEPDIHSTVYKCQASNSLGTIVSRDVVINAGK